MPPFFRSLLAALACATLLAPALPAAAAGKQGKIAANQGKAAGGKHRSSQRCAAGVPYLAKGVLAAGGALRQVAGADTRRGGDDRWSGTLVVQVTGGNRRGRADAGLRSYALERVRVSGFPTLLEPGTAVDVHGRRHAARCAARARAGDPTARVTVTRVKLRSKPAAQGTAARPAGDAHKGAGDDEDQGDDAGHDPADEGIEEVVEDDGAPSDEDGDAGDDPFGDAPWNAGPGSDEQSEDEGD